MTGERRGLLRRIHGACRALSEQANRPGYSPEDVKHDMKWLATVDGYPVETKRAHYRGKVVSWQEPVSLAGASIQTGMILMTAIQVVADEKGLWLYEYLDDDSIYKSVGGRSFEEMLKYIAELETTDPERARMLRKTPKWKYDESADSV